MVVDLPRGWDALVDEVVTRCDHVLVTVRPTVAGVAAAVRVCGRFADPERWVSSSADPASTTTRSPG